MEEVTGAALYRCEACPRLVALRQEVRSRHPGYHAAPVGAWGARRARLLIVGLAPGMHGANRTGRPFTGDASGTFLFQALHRAGFASKPEAEGASLLGCRITNAVKCLPPANKPMAKEIRTCGSYLTAELVTLRGERPRRPRCVLCLGRLAHDAVRAALNEPVGDFRHGQFEEISNNFCLADTYHPSRQNTNTGRLTADMLDAVLDTVAARLSG